MKKRIPILFFGVILLLGCARNSENLVTKSFEVGDKKCIIQQMPEEFGEGSKNGHFDYYRIIVVSNVEFEDSSHVNYINFGFENSIAKVVNADTIYPAFVQKIANGKKGIYEYIASFEKDHQARKFIIYINDRAFGIGTVTFNF